MRTPMHRTGMVAVLSLVLLGPAATAEETTAANAAAIKRVIADIKRRLDDERDARAAVTAPDAPAALPRTVQQLRQERDSLRRELELARARPAPADTKPDNAAPAGAAGELAGLKARLAEADRQAADAARDLAGLRQDLAARDARIARLEREIERRPLAGPATIQAVAPGAGPGAVAMKQAAAAERLSWSTTVLDAAAFGRSGPALSREGQRRVARVAELVREGKGPVRLVGHGNAGTELPPGAPDPEQATALQRAQRVRDLLVSRYGIDASRITVDTASPNAAPVAGGSGLEGRRVEVFIAQP